MSFGSDFIPFFKKVICTEAANLEVLLSLDETTEWNEEGNLSICTSLSSLDNESITEKDWEDTLRSFGPRFSKLADMVSGNDEESEDAVSSSSSNQELDGGTEI